MNVCAHSFGLDFGFADRKGVILSLAVTIRWSKSSYPTTRNSIAGHFALSFGSPGSASTSLSLCSDRWTSSRSLAGVDSPDDVPNELDPWHGHADAVGSLDDVGEDLIDFHWAAG